MEIKSIYNGIIDIGNFDFEKNIRIKIVPTDNPKKQNVRDCVRWLNVDQVIQLRDYLTTQINSQQNEGEMSNSELLILNGFTKDLHNVGFANTLTIPYALNSSIRESIQALITDNNKLQEARDRLNEWNDKLLAENKTWKDEVENIRTNYEYQKVGYEKCIIENEKLKSDLSTKNAIYENLVNINHSQMGKSEKLNQDKQVLSVMLKSKCDEIEKLRSEVEELNRDYRDMKSVYDNLIRIITIIPAVVKNGAMDFERAESFIKNALVKNRESGKWYSVIVNDTSEKRPAKYDNNFRGVAKWKVDGEYLEESEFTYISPTPIDLGE